MAGILSKLFGGSQVSGERRAFDELLAMGWGNRTIAGPSVTPEGALSSATVYACVQILSGSVAQMPLKLYRRLERGKETATDHPLYRLLHDRPNPEMSAFVFKEALMAHLLTWGNAYAEIEWGADGYPIALWPLLPDRMEIERKDGELVYVYRPDFVKPVPLPWWRVLHIPGLGFDGIVGYSPIRLQMQTLGGERAQAEYGWRFFANGARPGVVLKHPARLSPEAASRIRQSWNDLYQGANNAHRAAVLEEGMGIETIGIPPEEAQFLETRQFTKREIASFYRVPPQMIGDLQTATYASAEQFSTDFVVFSLGEWLKRWEEQIALRLLITEDEQRTLFPQFVRDALVITQTNERFAAYSTAVQSGIMTPNEVRERENLNPLPGGDYLMLPLNMAPADSLEDSFEDPNVDDSDDAMEGEGVDDAMDDGEDQTPQGRQALQPLIDDAHRRFSARIVNDVRNSGAKALRTGGQVALDEWSQKQLAEWLRAGESMLAPTLAAAQDLDVPIAVDVNTWLIAAYEAGVGELTHGD